MFMVHGENKEERIIGNSKELEYKFMSVKGAVSLLFFSKTRVTRERA